MPSCPKTSLAFAADKAKLYSTCSLDDRSVYFDVSCKPICKLVEDDLEEISAVVSGEAYLDHWEIGTYHCARCERLLCLLLQNRSTEGLTAPAAPTAQTHPHAVDANRHISRLECTGQVPLEGQVERPVRLALVVRAPHFRLYHSFSHTNLKSPCVAQAAGCDGGRREPA